MSDTQKGSPEGQQHESDGNSAEDASRYDRFAKRASELFEQGKDEGHEAWEKATDLARQQATAAGEFSAEQGEVFKRYMLRDLHQTAQDMRSLGVEAKERLNPARLGAGALSSVARLLHTAGGAATALSARAEDALVYQTGEITMAGTLTCTTCGEKVQLKATSVVPSCPECDGSSFRKSY